MENRILGALARLDDFLMNPLIQGYSGTAPETSWISFGTNQATNENDSQKDHHPEAIIFHRQTTQNSGPKDDHDSFLLSSIEKVDESNHLLRLNSMIKPSIWFCPKSWTVHCSLFNPLSKNIQLTRKFFNIANLIRSCLFFICFSKLSIAGNTSSKTKTWAWKPLEKAVHFRWDVTILNLWKPLDYE